VTGGLHGRVYRTLKGERRVRTRLAVAEDWLLRVNAVGDMTLKR
jgi:hypothetical protein